MAKIIAERLVAELKSSGFVIMRRPSGLIAVDPPLKQLTLPGRFPITAECQTAGVKARLRSTTPDPPGPPDPPHHPDRSILFRHYARIEPGNRQSVCRSVAAPSAIVPTT